MKRVMAAATAALVLCAANGAAAKDIPAAGISAQELVGWLKAKGMKAEVTKSDDGSVYVSTADQGINFDIDLYDCDAGRCRAIQFSMSFDLKDGLSLSKANTWNREKRYLKLYLDDQNDPIFQYDMNVAPGVTYEALDDTFATWTGFIPSVLEYIDW
ncbi:YbjN domain-containing protein [Caulobacter sp. 17J65-9]|uniref:YbjN domain-containing protein n=1 Tax=Caulobacter sp. 17J65-9 TaxID=2709382 RepID=UPI0013CC94C4|nr:YbjN domain-containing protein [Caulobacter sp. 17J65-9]NEX93372.1 YbjN domain-containing protein [Caulobacter sp. 17J65-9]